MVDSINLGIDDNAVETMLMGGTPAPEAPASTPAEAAPENVQPEAPDVTTPEETPAVDPEAPEQGEEVSETPAEVAPKGYVQQKEFDKRVAKLTADRNQYRAEIAQAQQRIAQAEQRAAELEQQVKSRDSDDDPYRDEDDDQVDSSMKRELAELKRETQTMKDHLFSAEAKDAEDWFGKQLENSKVDFPLMKEDEVLMNLSMMQETGIKVTLDDLREQAELSHKAMQDIEDAAVAKYLAGKKDSQRLAVEPAGGEAPSAPPFNPGKMSWEQLTNIAADSYRPV